MYTGNLFAGQPVFVTSKKSRSHCDYAQLTPSIHLYKAPTVDFHMDATLEMARKDLSLYLTVARSQGKPDAVTTEKAIKAASVLGPHSTLDVARSHFRERGQISQNIEYNYAQSMLRLIDLWPHMDTDLAPLREMVFSHLDDFASQFSKMKIFRHLLVHSESHPQELKEILLKLIQIPNPEATFGGDLVFADQIKNLLERLRIEPKKVQWTKKEVTKIQNWLKQKTHEQLFPKAPFKFASVFNWNNQPHPNRTVYNLEVALVYAQARVNLNSHLNHQPIESQGRLVSEEEREQAYKLRDDLRNRTGIVLVPR